MMPFLDSMSVNPEGGHALFEPTGQASSSSPSRSGQGTAAETTAVPEAAMFTDDSVSEQMPRTAVQVQHLISIRVVRFKGGFLYLVLMRMNIMFLAWKLWLGNSDTDYFS